MPQVHGKKNINDFEKWLGFLESLGYTNYWQDLNAKNYGVAQNRNRCFMFSFLGNYTYKFPQPIPLQKKLKDYLEEDVDEKYYINNEKAQKLIRTLIDNGTLPDTIHKSRAEQSRPVLTEQSTSLEKEMSQTALKQDTTQELATYGQMETVLLKDQGMTFYKKTDVANTLRSRDYKGFDNYGSNGVVEWWGVSPDVSRLKNTI